MSQDLIDGVAHLAQARDPILDLARQLRHLAGACHQGARQREHSTPGTVMRPVSGVAGRRASSGFAPGAACGKEVFIRAV